MFNINKRSGSFFSSNSRITFTAGRTKSRFTSNFNFMRLMTLRALKREKRFINRTS